MIRRVVARLVLVLLVFAPSAARAQKLVAALPEALTQEGPLLNASGSHLVVYSRQRLTPDDVDDVFDMYVYTVATAVWRRLPRSLLVGLWEAVDTAAMQALSVSDDGRYLAYTTRRVFPFAPPAPWVLARYDIDTGTRVVVRDAAYDPFALPVMSRDGSTFAWLGDRNAVIVATVGQTPLTVGEACPTPSEGECHRRPLLTEHGERVLYLVGPAGLDVQAERLDVFDRTTNTRTTYPEFRPRSTDVATTATGSHVFGHDWGRAGTVFELARRTHDPIATDVGSSPLVVSDDARYVLVGEGKVYDRQSSSTLASGAEFSRGLSADGRIIAVLLNSANGLLYALLDLDGDNDGMRDPWETVYGLDPGSALDGDLDADGDGVSNREEFARGSHPRGVFRRYFAEGVSSDFFETTVYAFATGTWMTARPRPITVTFTTEDGRSASRTLERFRSDSSGQATLPPILGPGAYWMLVESEDPLAAERITTWPAGAPVRGAHATSGAAAPDYLWVFAEGTTRGGAQMFLLLSNPGGVQARAVVRYLCADVRPTVRAYVVPARGRTTVWVNQEGTPLTAAECGAIVQSDRPLVAERSLYLLGDAGFSAGTSTVGAHSGEMSDVVTFGEGSTAEPFDMFLTILNPHLSNTPVRLTYTLPGGVTIQRTHQIGGEERATIWVDREDPRLASAPRVSVRIEAMAVFPVFVERAMWWRAPGVATWTEGHVERGTSAPAPKWALAHVPESATISILNTSDVAGEAKITMYAKNGVGAAERVIPLPPGLTAVRPTDLWPALGPDRYSATVESLSTAGAPPVPIVVERTSYAPDMVAGSTFLGTPVP